MSRAWVRFLIAAPIGVALLLSLLVACGGSSDGGMVNPTHKTIFLSSASYDGNLIGFSGADAKCQSAANAAHLGGTYRAWLNGSSVSAESRMTPSHLRYLLVNGTQVADDFTDLTDGSLDHAINVDQNGVTYGNPEVWTGTGSVHCNDWTTNSSGVNGVVGIASAVNGAWNHAYEQYCNRTNVRLYCFEQ